MSDERQAQLESTPWREKLTSKAAWADAASYAMADVKMLRRELVLGYGIAGFLTVLVPMTAWNDVFLRGRGFSTKLENVAIGPFIAFISFLCSVGNVPVAAMLWHGGISFIFADLIALPLVLIYRKYYGTALTLRLFATFWVVMAAAGLIVEGIFRIVGLVPATRPRNIVATHFAWNYTTFLNVLFVGVFVVLFWLYRNRARLGGGTAYALDPVCGMQVEKTNAPAHVVHDGHTVWFCSDRCQERFEADPPRYELGVKAEDGPPENSAAAASAAVDPICGMEVDPTTPQHTEPATTSSTGSAPRAAPTSSIAPDRQSRRPVDK